MTPADARALLLRFDGRIRFGAEAGVTEAEEIALRLRAGHFSDRRIGEAVGRPSGLVGYLVEGAASKLLAYHRRTARETLATCENRPQRERPTFENLVTGEEEEIRATQNAEDEKLRIHPNVLPTVDVLIAPWTQALSAFIDPREP